MQWLAALCVRRPVFATVLVLILSVVGIVAYGKLGLDFFPKIEAPIVTVTTRLPGASPQELESQVTDKLEESLGTLGGIDEMRSSSAEGVSIVTLSFNLEKNADVAAQEVRDKVNLTLPVLPKGIEQPTVTRLDPTASPVLYVAVIADKPLREVTEIADKTVRRALQNAPGVGSVSLLGDRKRQINVQLDLVKMRAYGISAAEIQRALAAQNVQLPGGSIDTGPNRIGLRIEGRVDQPAQLRDLVIRDVQGHQVTIGDVANVEDGEQDPETSAQKNGDPTIVLSIRKQSGENTVSVVDALYERIRDVQKQLPAGYRIEIVRDTSLAIRTSTDAVTNHLIEGSIFAALIVLLFLGNARATLIAALAIPTSIISTFSLLWMQDFTLNNMTLLALALAVGIVIDDAIVVLENIFKFIEEKKMSPFDAAIEGTKEIGLAVMATTLSLIAVFAPVAFLGGIVGQFLRQFGLTMAFSIAVSLFVSFTLTPMLASRLLKRHRNGAAAHAPQGNPHGTPALDAQAVHVQQKNLLERVVDVFYRPIERLYMVVLRWSMSHRWVIVLLIIGTLATIPLTAKQIPKSFLPSNDEAEFQISFRTPEGTSLAATDLAAERFAREVRKLDGVRYTLVTIGDSTQRTPNLANIYVRLINPDQRPYTQQDVMARVRSEIIAKQEKNLRISVADVPRIGGGAGNANVQYVISGPDLDQLTTYAKNVETKLRQTPGAIDVDTSIIVGKPEWVVNIDRAKAADLGISAAEIATTLRLLVSGEKASTIEQQGEQYDIHIRAAPGYRANEETIQLLTLSSPKAGLISVADIVDFSDNTGPATIERLNRRRQVTLSANAAVGYGESDIIAAIEQTIKEQNMPSSFTAGAGGRSRELGKATASFALAFGMSFLFMYLILAAQFESWLHPVTILLSLPLTLPFALLSLLMLGQSLNLYSALGILVLFGVVKKNSILQIDHTNHLRAQGMPRHEAILIGNRDRLRPILMTTAAFVVGMIPLVTSKGIGAAMSRATAGVIVGGQLMSLLLTLLATPVVYSLFDDAIQFGWRMWYRITGGQPVASEQQHTGNADMHENSVEKESL